MSFWANKRILVTGGAGFLGSRVVEKIKARGGNNVFVPRSKEYDLVKYADVIKLYEDTKAQLVLHLAAVVGGIGINQANPGRFFYDNLMMGVQMIEVGRQRDIEKFVAIGTICAYPKFTPVPFREEELWNGYPEETNAPYGLAKKMLLVQAQAYRQQYGFNTIYLLPVNLYGPNDNFAPHSSHVVPAIIAKCVDAVRNQRPVVSLWGAGTATREFLFVEDAAEGIVRASEEYDGSDPVNLGSSEEVSIKELAEIIGRLTGFNGVFNWDATKPDGQPRRKLDTTRAERLFGFRAKTKLEQGLKETIHWYRSQESG